MIDVAMVFAWIVLGILLLTIIAAIVILGSLPYKIALARNHPHASAINAASWVGLALGGIGWPVAFVWAFIPFERARATQHDGRVGKSEIPTDGGSPE